MRNRVQLTMLDIGEELYDEILRTYEANLVLTDNIYEKFYGSSDKIAVYYDDCKWIVMTQHRFDWVYYTLYGEYYFDDGVECWKQIKLRLDRNVDKAIKKISGTVAWNYINGKILSKYYSMNEIDNILSNYELDNGLKQFHYQKTLIDNDVHRYTNCQKYDITKAHASMLITMFPKAEKDMLGLLKKSAKYKEQGNYEVAQRYKDYINYYVGALCRHKHRKTYNYIVDAITNKLYKAMDITGGELLYANTDSFTVCDAHDILHTSNNVGEFKLEHNGDIYIHRGDNYWLMQYGDEMVGSSKITTRKYCNLKEGIVVKYKVNRILIGEDNKGKKYYREEVNNLCTEKVNVVEH